ncbi:MAG TPA: hypothetical protein V6C89_21650 [Drouetiella sp.]|jgi:hypothetical protein
MNRPTETNSESFAIRAQKSIQRLLASLHRQHMWDIASAFALLTEIEPDWASSERQQRCLKEFLARWSNKLLTVQDADMSDVKFLLISYRCQLWLSGVEKADSQPLHFSDEIRFALISLAALNCNVYRVNNLLRIELYDTEVLYRSVFNECWLMKKGADLIGYGERTPSVTLDLLQECLAEISVHSMILGSDPRCEPIDALRFGVISVLACAVSRASQDAMRSST